MLMYKEDLVKKIKILIETAVKMHENPRYRADVVNKQSYTKATEDERRKHGKAKQIVYKVYSDFKTTSLRGN